MAIVRFFKQLWLHRVTRAYIVHRDTLAPDTPEINDLYNELQRQEEIAKRSGKALKKNQRVFKDQRRCLEAMQLNSQTTNEDIKVQNLYVDHLEVVATQLRRNRDRAWRYCGYIIDSIDEYNDRAHEEASHAQQRTNKAMIR